MLSCLDRPIRSILQIITRFLPVKVIRDEKGVPFLYRYHLISFGKDGPGLCIHNFVKSDPDRGYHDHPWNSALAFILCGSYEERIFSKSKKENNQEFITFQRNMFTFNYLNGKETFHRVMVNEENTVWTLFAFGKRSKTWGMIGLEGDYKAMSTQISDNDGGWWYTVPKGAIIHEHLPLKGNVIVTVDSLIINDDSQQILLIKRGKEPFKGMFAFPGGRVESNDKDVESACYRELKEETNISNVKLAFYQFFGNAQRDPRGFCITFVFVGSYSADDHIRAGDDAVDYKWFDLKDLPESLAFDHKQIIEQYCYSQTQ